MDLLSMGNFIRRSFFSIHPPQAQFIIGLVPLEARASYFVLSDNNPSVKTINAFDSSPFRGAKTQKRSVAGGPKVKRITAKVFISL